ncbi:MAG TPA: MerR family DNA-binding transcriptional regulator [Umezawaea sp.]|nr:MerR family DNA-binding transcriptional regulator [Umezawaea sp.]
MRKLISSGELAEELGVSTRTIARYAADGLLIPAETTIGGHFRWVLEDVRQRMRELRQRDE